MAVPSRFRIIAGLIVAATGAAAFVTLNQTEATSREQTTDDAYVEADFTVVAPQVAGVISAVAVEDNQPVRAGALMVTLDDRDFLVARRNAQAHAASAQAVIAGLQGQILRQQSAIAEARAAVVSDQARLKLAEADRHRFANLAADGSGTRQAQEQAEAGWRVQQAMLDHDQAALQAAIQQVPVLDANLAKARADLDAAEAERTQADLRLTYTRITAPIDGIVAQRRARLGGYARVGEPLLTIVPLNAVYVEANFRETQLARMQVGQPVVLTVDALPGVTLKGAVESLGPASGVSFSAVPPHNATGNFTKIVQRLPVRIRLLPGQEGLDRLRLGMSVVPHVDVAAVPASAQKALQGETP